MKADARRHLVYGIRLESEFPFRTPLSPGHGPPDLAFTLVEERPASEPGETEEPAFASRHLAEDGRPQIELYRRPGFDIIRHSGVAEYYLGPRRIACRLLDAGRLDLVEVYFLSLLCGLWLERNGRLALHASAVDLGGRAVAFLATNTGGKTSLAASLMLADHPLLTDDFLAISLPEGPVTAWPSFPQMRMWPELADHFLGGHAALPRVLADTEKRRVPVGEAGIGSFCPDPRPLVRLYLPARRPGPEGDVRLERVEPGEALIQLVRESFLSTVLEKTGLHAARFERLATLARTVPMVRLSYPSGLDRLPEVRRVILADVGSGL